MSVYKSAEVNIPSSAENVFNRLSNLENLRDLIKQIPSDRIPEDKRKAFEDLKITQDTISFPAGPVGSMTFRMTEKTPYKLIRLEGEGSPVPIALMMHLTPENDTSSKGQVEIDIEIPALLKPMIGGQIQKMADQFGEMLRAIPFL